MKRARNAESIIAGTDFLERALRGLAQVVPVKDLTMEQARLRHHLARRGRLPVRLDFPTPILRTRQDTEHDEKTHGLPAVNAHEGSASVGSGGTDRPHRLTGTISGRLPRSHPRPVEPWEVGAARTVSTEPDASFA